jgi:hypothetical protein
MGKWSSMKGRIPALSGAPDWMNKVYCERESIARDLAAQDLPLDLQRVTRLYNEAREEKDALAAREKQLNIRIEALQQLILAKLEESGSDVWRGNGYSFSEKPEPYASTDDKDAVIEHFVPVNKAINLLTKGKHADVLEVLQRMRYELSHVSIAWQTINSLVKAEAEAGELVMEGEGDKTTARCSIPGVKVFLKSSINRRKAGGS